MIQSRCDMQINQKMMTVHASIKSQSGCGNHFEPQQHTKLGLITASNGSQVDLWHKQCVCVCVASYSEISELNRSEGCTENHSDGTIMEQTCRWCRTYQCASGCSSPAAFVAPWSGRQFDYPASGDACSPERLGRGSYSPGCCFHLDNLERETHGLQIWFN